MSHPYLGADVMDESDELSRAAEPARARIRRDRGRVPPRLERVLAYVEEHLFDRGLNVTRVKEACGVRDNSLLIRFTSTLGRPPWAYIEDRRLETACRLLTESQLEIWRIAKLLGYTSLQVFSRAFARWSGERPSSYRRRPPGGLGEQPRRGATTVRKRSRKPSVPPPRGFSRVKPELDRAAITAIQADEILAEIQRRPPRTRRELLDRLHLTSPTLVRRLCRASRERAQDRPQRAIDLAELALAASEGLSRRIGRALFVRLRVECWAELANAYRAAGQLGRARRALAAGEARLAEQPTPAALRALVLAAKTAFYRDERRFQEALRVADQALTLARRAGDKTLLAEILVQKASLLSGSGDPAGVALLEEALVLMRE